MESIVIFDIKELSKEIGFRKMLRNGASRLAYAILLVGLFIGAIGILDKRPDLKYGHFLLFVSSFLIFIVMLKWILRKKRD